MRIADIRVYPLTAPLERPFWMSLEPYTAASELVVEVLSDEGLVGIGEVHGKPMSRIAELLVGPVLELVRGRDPLETETIWQDVFSLSHSRSIARLSPREVRATSVAEATLN